MRANQVTPPLPAGIYGGVFLISTATLFLEVLQTRIFSVMLWHHITYLVVTFTLLGFAASGTFLAVSPRLFERRLGERLALVAMLFAASTVLAFLVLTFVRLDTVRLLQDRTQYLYVFVYYAYLVIPYFMAGLAIGAALKAQVQQAPRLYAVNLIGSAAGCYLFIEVLKPLGGAASIVLAAALGAAAAVAFALAGESRTVRVASVTVTLLLVALLPWAEDLLHIHPAPSKAMAQEVEMARASGQEPPRAVLTEWDPLCRIDVVSYPDEPHLKIYQDADAPTLLFSASDPPPHLASVYALGHYLKNRPRVLVIGVGGGQDLWHGYLNKAASVTGAEINPTIVELMTGPYRGFSGGIYEMPADPARECGPVCVHVAEGRSFVRRSSETYDLIQMTGTDTYTALSSGAYVMSESYLYTVEAFCDYLDHLSPDGLVAVLRFRFDPPRESLRLVVIAATAMRLRGIAHPERCIAVLTMRRTVKIEGHEVVVPYAVMLFKKGELLPHELEKIEAFPRLDPKVYELTYVPGCKEPEVAFGGYLEALVAGPQAERAFIDAYPFDITATTDDAPFFFRYHRWSRLFEPSVMGPGAIEPGGGGKTIPGHGEAWFRVIGQDPIALYILVTVLAETLVLILVLVLVPLLFFRREGLRAPGKMPIFAFFFSIGLAYLLLEIAAMQKFVLYLGHPTYSITVVLASFLLFSGVGSSVAGRLESRPGRALAIAVPCIVALIVGYTFLLPALFAATLGWAVSARVLLSVALLALPAFFMGMPFPTALKLVGEASPALVPWAWGVNGSASVLASVVSIMAAMASGFTVVFVAAAAFYALALSSLWPLVRRLRASGAT
ncbi:MAG: hypothetical protein AB1486_13155 [Planctomycetota bacterium]